MKNSYSIDPDFQKIWKSINNPPILVANYTVMDEYLTKRGCICMTKGSL
jgi:hypothetical protein